MRERLRLLRLVSLRAARQRRLRVARAQEDRLLLRAVNRAHRELSVCLGLLGMLSAGEYGALRRRQQVAVNDAAVAGASVRVFVETFMQS